MSLAKYMSKQKDFQVVPIAKKTLIQLSNEVKLYAVAGQHTHVVAMDASENFGRCGLGIVFYDIAKNSVEIIAVRVNRPYGSVDGELCALKEVTNYLPKTACPLLQTDQKYVIDYLLRRTKSNPTGGVAQPYIETATKIERKFRQFHIWWSKSKEGEILHSIADAVAAHACSGRTRNHQNGKFMSLDSWSNDYDFVQSDEDYTAFLVNNSPLQYPR